MFSRNEGGGRFLGNEGVDKSLLRNEWYHRTKVNPKRRPVLNLAAKLVCCGKHVDKLRHSALV